MEFANVDGLAVADTGGMQAVTGRRPWVIRACGLRRDEGYPIRETRDAVAGATEPVLITATEAWIYLRIPAGTVWSWHSRDRLHSYECNGQGHPLYSVTELVALRDGRR